MDTIRTARSSIKKLALSFLAFALATTCLIIPTQKAYADEQTLYVSTINRAVDNNRDAGGVVNTYFEFYNDSDETIYNIMVYDESTGAWSDVLVESLEPGVTTEEIYYGSYTITQDDVEWGVAIKNLIFQWTTESGQTETYEHLWTTSADQSFVIAVDLSADTDTIEYASVGDIITYTLTVTNSGTAKVYDVTATNFDNLFLADVLSRGESVTTTIEYAITQEDIDAGYVSMTADIYYTDLTFVNNYSKSSDEVTIAILQSVGGLKFTKLAGDNRYETMAKIVSEGFDSSDVVVLASGEKFPDALAGSGLAGALNAPIVLVGSNPTQAIQTIEALGASQIYVLGDENTISESVLSEITSATGATAERIAGASRQETALAIVEFMLDELNVEPTVAIITYCDKYADALSISSYAYATGASIFLTQGDGSISNAVVEAIEDGGYETILILGDENSVSEEAEENFPDAIRLAGDNRYETSAIIADYAASTGVLSYETITIATGENFPDALAGGAFAGVNNSVVLLAKEDSQTVFDLISKNASSVKNIYVLGDENSVSSATCSAIIAAATS